MEETTDYADAAGGDEGRLLVVGSGLILFGRGRHVAGVRRGIDAEIRVSSDSNTRELVADVLLRRSNRHIALLKAAHSGLLEGDPYRSLVGCKLLATRRDLGERITNPYVGGFDRRCAVVRWWGFVRFVQRPRRSGPAGQPTDEQHTLLWPVLLPLPDCGCRLTAADGGSPSATIGVEDHRIIRIGMEQAYDGDKKELGMWLLLNGGTVANELYVESHRCQGGDFDVYTASPDSGWDHIGTFATGDEAFDVALAQIEERGFPLNEV